MANYNKSINDTMCRIGEVRFSYPRVFTPAEDNQGKKKYSCCIIIDKKNTEAIDLINEKVAAAKELGKNKWNGKIPAMLKTPLRDGDVERPEDPAFKGCYFFNCSSRNKPRVAIPDELGSYSEIYSESEDFYAGCYGTVAVNFYPYDTSGNRGVGVGLGNILKLRDGDRLAGGSASLEDTFADLMD